MWGLWVQVVRNRVSRHAPQGGGLGNSAAKVYRNKWSETVFPATTWGRQRQIVCSSPERFLTMLAIPVRSVGVGGTSSGGQSNHRFTACPITPFCPPQVRTPLAVMLSASYRKLCFLLFGFTLTCVSGIGICGLREHCSPNSGLKCGTKLP